MTFISYHHQLCVGYCLFVFFCPGQPSHATQFLFLITLPSSLFLCHPESFRQSLLTKFGFCSVVFLFCLSSVVKYRLSSFFFFNVFLLRLVKNQCIGNRHLLYSVFIYFSQCLSGGVTQLIVSAG